MLMLGLTSIRGFLMITLLAILGLSAVDRLPAQLSSEDPAPVTTGSVNQAVLVIPRQTVTRTIVGDNGRRWRSAFDVEATEEGIAIEVRINLIPSGTVTPHEIQQRLVAWQAAIESAWSDQHALRVGTNTLLPIRISVRFTGHDPHHHVIVRDFAPANDQLHWSLEAEPRTVAHEFGHMIGAYDEYVGGGTSLDARTIDPLSIMAARPTSSTTLPRHLWLIEEALMHAQPHNDVQVVRQLSPGNETAAGS